MSTLEKLRAEGWPDALISRAQWDALPESEGPRFECVEGVVQIVPNPEPRHQYAVVQLAFQLGPQLPQELVAIHEVDVVLFDEPLTVRIPDLVVAPRTILEPGHHVVSAEVVLAVEVGSPWSGRVDRVMKLSEYQDAGIEHYWILDVEHRVLSTFRLIEAGHYTHTGDHVGEATVDLLDRTVTIDIAALS